MALEAQNNPFTSVLMVEAADPEALPDADPSAGSQRLAVGTDHLLYLVNSSGVKTQVGGASGLTDPMTTRGDIIVRNSSNVTARLAIGSSGKVLSSNGTDISWQTPAAAAATLLAVASFASSATTSSNGTLVAVDGTNLAPTITVPSSGKVLVRLSGFASWSTQDMMWGLLDGSGATLIAARMVGRFSLGGTLYQNSVDFYLTGLTPAASLQIKWAYCLDGAGGSITFSNASPATMSIWSAP